ncbi:hypothetical protein PFICI_03288 [Pestalotiopsis fici W106-1]|uniref:Uncharacterized protein n=1 Tax=Pestalotiopsis fici (strain W106-1 / CGMCC3.15140) TaxID=1229662 RepID=W3XGR4_PESFW|nr:uncharacterized protein PFICI_03288 [Pestalotiopsis fici W106-1]ETS85263.1 hypothetical protein PFICI_03288 [Pestalotiopsis fici W106-1]
MAIWTYPFHYQSSDISFQEWISLFTLCLAPFIAHVFAGAPRPSILASASPPWHEYMCIYNPTAIIFRYAAIVDRRIRAHEWVPHDAAAANALFWTDQGWDGSEHMRTNSLQFCTLLPEQPRTRILSMEMLKTIITTLQGVQAAVRYIGAAAGTVYMITGQPAVDAIFGPLSLLGLFRIFAGFWLVDDYTYSTAISGASAKALQTTSLEPLRRPSLDSLYDNTDAQGVLAIDGQYKPTTQWGSRAFRSIYFLLLVVLWVLVTVWTFVGPLREATMTVFLMAAYHFVLFTVTMAVCAWYFCRGRTTSTILPCISHVAFKAYTVFWLLATVALVVVAALETFKTPCGTYTSIPAKFSGFFCSDDTTKVNPNRELAGVFETFALASQYNTSVMDSGVALKTGEFWLMNFTGICLGAYDDNHTWSLAQTTGFTANPNIDDIVTEGWNTLIE